MPPPKPTTEGRDRRVAEEQRQLLRALRAHGELSPDELRRLVGADYWDAGRFDRALALAVADGLVVVTAEGSLATV
jgi:hypothetical protein